MVIALVLIVGFLSVGLLTDYIWMDSEGFRSVFVSILSSKLLLAAVGFVVFLVLSVVTFYWIRSSYISYLDNEKLPPIILEKKKSSAIIFAISLLIGLLGSSLVQGLVGSHY